MASTSEIAKRYFEALSAHDLDAATACWAHRGVDRFVGSQELIAPAAVRDCWDLTKLARQGRAVLGRLLPIWDGGAVKIADTVEEGDKIAGFEVVHLPAHAPGQIGLFRESDRLALVSDCIYTLDPQTGIKGAARAPHPAFKVDTEQARASIRKPAALDPSIVWTGHAEPVTGDARSQLEHAAAPS